MKAPFKGTDTTDVNFDQDSVRVIDALLEKTSFAGGSLELGNSLDALFSGDGPQPFSLSHDHLALLCEIFTKAAFTRAARPAATIAQATVVAAHQSFYKED